MPELLNKTFQSTDTLLAEKRVHAGCTAVVAFMRSEMRDPRQRLKNPFSQEEEEDVRRVGGDDLKGSEDHHQDVHAIDKQSKCDNDKGVPVDCVSAATTTTSSSFYYPISFSSP